MIRTRHLVLVLAALASAGAAVVLSRFFSDERGLEASSLESGSGSPASASPVAPTRLEAPIEEPGVAQGARVSTAIAPPVPVADAAAAAAQPPPIPAPSVAELQEKVKSLSDDLEKRSTPLLYERYERGQSELLEGTTYSGRKNDSAEIYMLRVPANSQTMYRVVLPREEFRELYVIKDEILALRERIGKLEYEAFLAKHKQGE